MRVTWKPNMIEACQNAHIYGGDLKEIYTYQTRETSTRTCFITRWSFQYQKWVIFRHVVGQQGLMETPKQHKLLQGYCLLSINWWQGPTDKDKMYQVNRENTFGINLSLSHLGFTFSKDFQMKKEKWVKAQFIILFLRLSVILNVY